jgi:nucleoside-diphosphate-sugar epimerase
MRILVIGASGVVGRVLVPRLLAEGHEVYGSAVSAEGVLAVDRLGAKVLRIDLLDEASVRNGVERAKPEGVVNLATAIPLRLKLDPRDWEQTNRLRNAGLKNLVAACRTQGGLPIVQEDVGYVCASKGDGWMDESAPRSRHAFLQPVVQMEDFALGCGLPVTLLRFAAVLGAEFWHTQQMVAALRRGMLPLVGDGSAFMSLVHVEDAARAIQLAVTRPPKSGSRVYNVVDEEPARMRDVLPYVARLLNAPAPRRVPAMLASLAAGALTMEILGASYRMSGARIREDLGFQPRYPTYRETWQEVGSHLQSKTIDLSGDAG